MTSSVCVISIYKIKDCCGCIYCVFLTGRCSRRQHRTTLAQAALLHPQRVVTAR